MTYAYTARDLSGRMKTGNLAAETAAAAASQLRQEGLFVVSLAEEKVAAVAAGVSRNRVSRSEIIGVTTQLAVMVDAGVSLASAVRGAASQAANPALAAMLNAIADHVESGEPFSSALAKHPRHFDKTYVNLVRAAEASGSLGGMLDRLAIQMQNERETRGKVIGALIYPAAMLSMCVGTGTFLLTYVFPKLTPMFVARKLDLPLPTKVLMALSQALTGYWYLFLAAAVVGVGTFLHVRRQTWGRRGLDWFWLRTPAFGPMLRKVALSRSLRTLATTVNAGVPMLDALKLSSGVAGNVWYEAAWGAVAEQVSAGRQINQALDKHPLFPATLVQMISSGEATGRLGPVLAKSADALDREVAAAVKNCTSLIEPVMVFLMGGVIGTIALAMLLPIFKLSGSAG